MKLSERDIAQAYIGKRVSSARVSELFRANGKYMENDMHIAYCPSFADEKRDLFGITARLYGHWEYYGIDCRINIYSENGTVSDCSILKYKEGCGGHGRPSGHYLTPTQQELRIFRRIMDYVTA